MATPFATRFSGSPLSRLATAFGEPDCKYFGSGDGVELTGIKVRLTRHAPAMAMDSGGHVTMSKQTGEAKVQASVVSNPVAGGRFQIDGEVWSIVARPMKINGQFICTVERSSAENMNARRSGNV